VCIVRSIADEPSENQVGTEFSAKYFHESVVRLAFRLIKTSVTDEVDGRK